MEKLSGNEFVPIQSAKGVLQFGEHAVHNNGAILNSAQLLADDIKGVFKREERNIIVFEASNAPSHTSDLRADYFRQYGSHLKAFFATALQLNSRVVTTETIDNTINTVFLQNKEIQNFVLAYSLALDTLKTQGYEIEVRYENSQIPPEEVSRLVTYLETGFETLESKNEFIDYFRTDMEKLFFPRNKSLAKLVIDTVEEAEKSKALTNIFGFFGYLHAQGVSTLLGERIRSVITCQIQDCQPAGWLGILRRRLARGENLSEEEWGFYYKLYLGYRSSLGQSK